jgi:hypothetical protein
MVNFSMMNGLAGRLSLDKRAPKSSLSSEDATAVWAMGVAAERKYRIDASNPTVCSLGVGQVFLNPVAGSGILERVDTIEDGIV